MSTKLARISSGFREAKPYKEPELGRRSVKPSEEHAGITESLLGEMIKTQLKRQSLQPSLAGGMHGDAEIGSLAGSSKHGSHSGLALLALHSRAASASGEVLLPLGALQLGEQSPGSSDSALIGAHMLDSQLEMFVMDSAAHAQSSKGSASASSLVISPPGSPVPGLPDGQQSPTSTGGMMVLEDVGSPGAGQSGEPLGRRLSHVPSRFSPVRRSSSLLPPSPGTTQKVLQVPSRPGSASPDLMYPAAEGGAGGAGAGGAAGAGCVPTLGGSQAAAGSPSRRTTGGGHAGVSSGQVVINMALGQGAAGREA
jgi:hypothetical protein